MTEVRAATLQAETASGAVPAVSAAAVVAESAAGPVPAVAAADVAVEAASVPAPGVAVATLQVEVLRRETAASAPTVSAVDAFGERAWPEAQVGVFAFRHDWSEALVERWVFATDVQRTASGTELRKSLRMLPRRSITYQAGHGRATDALVGDWLADHIGRIALWPMPFQGGRVTAAAARGEATLSVALPWRDVDPPELTWAFEDGGLDAGWKDDRLLLILWETGWQVVQADFVWDTFINLTDPLARPVPAGAAVYPLVFGVAEAADLAQWLPGVASGDVTAQVAPPEEITEDPGDPLLDARPVWPDGNWQDDPTATADGVVSRQDLSPAFPWLRRDDPWPANTYQRRYLATSRPEIARLRARLWRTRGRLGEFWLPDGLAPVLRVTAPAGLEAGYLRVDADAAAFWHRPAGCLLIHPDGTRQYALTATCHHDDGGVLVLRTGLDAPVPAGSRVIRLVRCRLDHDAIDWHWHTTDTLEVTITARQVPEGGRNPLPFEVGY
jgi:hypothetical protein